jgi:breakpoint cluster region protein
LSKGQATKTTTLLNSSGLQETGIFRLSGASSEMNELKELIEMGMPYDLHKYSVHSVAGILKLFFRQLPEPLFTFRFEEFTKALGMKTIQH